LLSFLSTLFIFTERQESANFNSHEVAYFLPSGMWGSVEFETCIEPRITFTLCDFLVIHYIVSVHALKQSAGRNIYRFVYRSGMNA